MTGRINRKKKNNTWLMTQVTCVSLLFLFIPFFSSLFRLPRVCLTLFRGVSRGLIRRDKKKGHWRKKKREKGAEDLVCREEFFFFFVMFKISTWPIVALCVY